MDAPKRRNFSSCSVAVMSGPDDQTFYDEIEGYCGELSYFAGETVSVHVSTTASSFNIRVERWGATRDTVLELDDVNGEYIEPPPNADAEGCGWPESLTFKVDPAWRSGFYLVTLSARGAAAGRDTAHACFAVRGSRNVSERSGVLYVLATNTWNAYNTWGGKSLYTGGTQVAFHRPFARGMLDRPVVDRDDRKARPTRFREVPDADGHTFQGYRTDNGYPSAIGSSGWFTYDRRFVGWAEAAGYTFDFAVSSDLATDPTCLDGYASVLLVGHDEYWSAPARDAVETHVSGGGALASFSGNTMFWQVRREPTTHGHAMVGFKYRGHLDDPVMVAGREAEMSGMWADPIVDRPEWALLGAGSAHGLYHRFGQATAAGVGGFLVSRADHWLFQGTGLGYGDVLGRDDGVVGYETVGCPLTLDEFHQPVVSELGFAAGVPVQTEIVGWVPSSNLGVGEYPKSIAALSDQGDLEFVAQRIFGGGEQAKLRARHGNAVMLTTRPFGDTGGEVITIGSTDWAFGLEHDVAVQQVTRNVLDRL